MEDLFYPGYWSTRPARPRAAPPAAMAKPSRPAKVVSIPVQFVSSDDTKRRQQPEANAPVSDAADSEHERIAPSTAALAIQRAFRGFVVRKNLKAVRRIEAEVDAVEKEVAQAGDRLRRDARERIRVNETLMALLFRLDSVRGVREYRRRVIRRAIALGDDAGETSEGDAPLEIAEAREATPAEITPSVDSDLQTLESHNEEQSSRDKDTEVKKAMEEDSAGEVAAKELEEEGSEDFAKVAMEELEEEESEDFAKVAMEELHDLSTNGALRIDDALSNGSGADDMCGASSVDRIGDPLGDAAQASLSSEDKCIRELGEGNGEVEKEQLCPPPEETPSSHGPSAQSPTTVEGAPAQGCRDAAMRQAMETMVEENRGLKGLVADLCERNEVQLRLMEGLLQRVERLEKVVEKMGRRKQKGKDAKKCHARKCERGL